MKRAIVVLLPILVTVACAEREKEAPPTPAPAAASAPVTFTKPTGLLVKKPVNIAAKTDTVGAPDLPQAPASASAAPPAK